MTRQPLVRANDWTVLKPAAVGELEPTRTVSVVVPAYGAHATLPLVLAALAAQSYPSSLLEVVVVDDGSHPALELPELRPENTRLIRTTGSWGRAHACRQGAEAAEGEVIHWLDADMLVYREHVEAQLRWHHEIDYAVVLGHKMFVDPADAVVPLDPGRVHDEVAHGRAAQLFAGAPATPHDWVEARYDSTKDLAGAGHRAYSVHVGATASVGRELYLASGGMDSSLKLGEDIELGYRLSQLGAVFVPEREAGSWHLGPSTVMRRRDEVNRYNAPFLADRVSQLRYRRTAPGRVFAVPYLQVVIDVHGCTLEEAGATVDGVLGSIGVEVEIMLLGPWEQLDDGRRSPLSDPLLDLRLVQGSYSADQRVHFVADVAASAFPAAFRATLPVRWVPDAGCLRAVLVEMERHERGLQQVLMPDGTVARFERTAAVSRAARVAQPDDDVDDVMDRVYGSWWSDGPDFGFALAGEPAPHPSGDLTATVRSLKAENAALRAQLVTVRLGPGEDTAGSVPDPDARSSPGRGRWRRPRRGNGT